MESLEWMSKSENGRYTQRDTRRALKMNLIFCSHTEGRDGNEAQVSTAVVMELQNG